MPFGPNFFASLYWEPVPSNRRTPLSAPASKRCLNLLDSGETTMMMRKFLSLVLVLSFCGVAIAADTLTLKDGTAHTGTVIRVTSRTVTFKEAGTLHKFPRSSVESLQFGGSHAGSTSKEATSTPVLGENARKEVTLPAGTEIAVLANENIDSSTASEGQTFPADVAENVMNRAGQGVTQKGSEPELWVRKFEAGGVTSTPELLSICNPLR